MTEDEAFERKVNELRKQIDRIEAVMRQLPLLPEQEEHVRGLSSNVVVAARGDYAVSRGDKAAIRALDTLSKKLRELWDIFNVLPLEAEQALKETGGLGLVEIPFEDLVRQAETAKERLKAKPEKKKAGRPEARLAAEVAREALSAYEMLTGKWAGVTTDAHKEGHPRSGAFLHFLTEIFGALKITASPDSQAKKVTADKSAHRKFSEDAITEAFTEVFKDYVPPDPDMEDLDAKKEFSSRILEVGKIIEAMQKSTRKKPD
jgi:hypothetical protein